MTPAQKALLSCVIEPRPCMSEAMVGLLSGCGGCSQFEVKEVVWDEGLGAEKLDLLLLDHFADEFQAKHGMDIRQFPKAVAKLKRQVQISLSLCLHPGFPSRFKSYSEHQQQRQSLALCHFFQHKCLSRRCGSAASMSVPIVLKAGQLHCETEDVVRGH